MGRSTPPQNLRRRDPACASIVPQAEEVDRAAPTFLRGALHASRSWAEASAREPARKRQDAPLSVPFRSMRSRRTASRADSKAHLVDVRGTGRERHTFALTVRSSAAGTRLPRPVRNRRNKARNSAALAECHLPVTSHQATTWP